MTTPVVAIDPGHGGTAEGTTGVCGAEEKNVALAVSRELANILDASGRVHAVLTRTGDEDVSLEERAARAGRAGASVLISIHANSSARAEHSGLETYFLSRQGADRRTLALAKRENDGHLPPLLSEGDLAGVLGSLRLSAAHSESQRLAERLQSTLEGQLENRGRGVLQAPFLVLLHADMAAALVEVGFLSNPDECLRLASLTHQRRVAMTLAAAILLHLDAEQRLAVLSLPPPAP